VGVERGTEAIPHPFPDDELGQLNSRIGYHPLSGDSGQTESSICYLRFNKICNQFARQVSFQRMGMQPVVPTENIGLRASLNYEVRPA